MITITKLSEEQYEVVVSMSSTTTHIVTVTDTAHHSLSAGTMSKEELLKASFDFLVAREPNTSILARFEITDISHYFPDYKSAMQAQSQGGT